MGVKLAMQSQTIYWLSMIPAYSDRLVLMRMALQPRDIPGPNGEPAHVYYGGREALMLALSEGELPDRDTPAYDNHARKIRYCLARLAKAGAIQRIDDGRRGHNSVYRLTLGGQWRGS